MTKPFAQRIQNVRRSFLRDLVKITQKPDIITFSGGMPNEDYFAVDDMNGAMQRAMEKHGRKMMQYGPSSGYQPLREFIAHRYQTRLGMDVTPDEIIITNGAQQGIDLSAKVLLDPGDRLITEAPTYMGAVQCLSIYEPEFVSVPLEADGVNVAALREEATHPTSKLAYLLPNFQNPSGISYTAMRRQQVADVLNESGLYYIEDDPYRDVYFEEAPPPPLRAFGADNGFLLGSFSKIVSPGLRLGWVVAKPEMLEKFLIAKQAADLHTTQMGQHILHEYLMQNDLDAHIVKIREAYRQRRDLMIELMEECFPGEVHFTRPKGGLFLWVTLPPHLSAMDLFYRAVERGVVFVPGAPFFTHDAGENCLRLSYSRVNPDQIETGIRAIAESLGDLMLERV